MDQNVSKKEVVDVSGEEQGRSIPQWFGKVFGGRKKNRSSQGGERYYNGDISDLDSSKDPLSCDDRHHSEFDLPSVRLADESVENHSSESIEQASAAQSDAKKKQQKLLEEFAFLSGIELSPQSSADLRDSVEKQLETEPLLLPLLVLETDSIPQVIEPSKITDIAPVLEKKNVGRVHDAYTFLIENKKAVQDKEGASNVGANESDGLVVESSAVAEEAAKDEVEPDAVLEEGNALGDESLVRKPVYDQEAMDSILSELNKINSIHSVVIVGDDGSILACNNPDKLKESAFNVKSVRNFKRLGQKSGLGLLTQTVIEFSEGKLIIENLGDSALFIAVDRTAILGSIRNQTKSQIEKLKLILN